MKIANKKQDYLSLFLVFGTALILVVHYFRDNTQSSGVISTILGSAPNFIATFCLPTVFIVKKEKMGKVLHRIGDVTWFILCTILSLLIVLAWEFRQLGTNEYVFDINDIIASFVGAILFLFCYPIVRRLLGRHNP